MMPVIVLLVCALTSRAEERGLPTGPIAFTSTGVLFNGGSLSIQLTDATDVPWQLNYPPIECPLPMARQLGVTKHNSDAKATEEPVERAVGSDDEASVYNQLTAWLGRTCSEDEIAGIRDDSIWDTFPPGRPIFDAIAGHTPPHEPDPRRSRISQASQVLLLLEAITVERATLSNPRLKQQYDELLSQFDDQRTNHDDATMDDLTLRWQQFHDTARAALCGPDWSPTEPLARLESVEKTSVVP